MTASDGFKGDLEGTSSYALGISGVSDNYIPMGSGGSLVDSPLSQSATGEVRVSTGLEI